MHCFQVIPLLLVLYGEQALGQFDPTFQFRSHFPDRAKNGKIPNLDVSRNDAIQRHQDAVAGFLASTGAALHAAREEYAQSVELCTQNSKLFASTYIRAADILDQEKRNQILSLHVNGEKKVEHVAINPGMLFETLPIEAIPGQLLAETLITKEYIDYYVNFSRFSHQFFHKNRDIDEEFFKRQACIAMLHDWAKESLEKFFLHYTVENKNAFGIEKLTADLGTASFSVFLYNKQLHIHHTLLLRDIS